MAIEVLDQGSTRVMLSVGFAPGNQLNGLGLLGVVPGRTFYDTPLDPAEFIGFMTVMTWPSNPNPSRSIFPLDTAGFTIGFDFQSPMLGFCIVVYRIVQRSIPVTPFTP
jgi:hypothetical protein